MYHTLSYVAKHLYSICPPMLCCKCLRILFWRVYKICLKKKQYKPEFIRPSRRSTVESVWIEMCKCYCKVYHLPSLSDELGSVYYLFFGHVSKVPSDEWPALDLVINFYYRKDEIWKVKKYTFLLDVKKHFNLLLLRVTNIIDLWRFVY